MATEQTPLLSDTSLNSFSRLGPGAPSLNDIPRGRTDTVFNNSDVHPQNINELLIMLERATSLVRQHAQTGDEPEGSQRSSRPLIPRWITNYLILITFIWQAVNVGFLEIIHHFNNETNSELDLSSDIVMTIFQAVHLILVFFVSFKLAKQVIHRTASGSLLAQCYLSTVLLFAGLYTLVYRFDSSVWKYVKFDGEEEPRPILLFARMLYFSVSTATLCGTSAVEPIEWYVGLTVSLQMLMSFVYFASILSLGIVPRKRSKYNPPPGPLKSFTRLCRRCCLKDRA